MPNQVPKKERFTVLGHRGAMGDAPENTLPSFRKGVELMATMVELDIHLSKDGELVVIHDATVDRTTNGTGNVSDLTWPELARLDAGSWFAPEFVGARIPRLEEVLDAVADQVLINIEIKKGPDGPYPEIVDRMAALLEKLQCIDRVVISSFEPSYLRNVRSRLPEVEIAILYSKPWPDVMDEALRQGWNGLHVHRSLVTKEYVDEAHAKGLVLRAWNPNDPGEMRRLIEAGVDGIGTDYPKVLYELAREMGVL